MRKPFIFLWAAAGIVLIFFWIYLPVLTRYRELKIEEENMTARLSELDSKILALQEERELLKNDVTYLEKVIRDELGLVKPGETVYRFVEEKPAMPENAED